MSCLAVSIHDAIETSEAACSQAIRGSVKGIPPDGDSRLPSVREHLHCLADAIELDAPRLFEAHAEWTSSVLSSRGYPKEAFVEALRILGGVLDRRLPVAIGRRVGSVLDAAIEHVETHDRAPAPVLTYESPLSGLARRYLDALLRGRSDEAQDLILEAIEGTTTIRDVYLEILQPAQQEIGRLWQLDEISVAQEHYCTAATQLVMARLYPRMFRGEKRDRTLLVTCVEGELHEIGARMVADFFEMDGWTSYYVGASIPPAELVDTLIEQKVALLAISATLLSHVGRVEEMIRHVREAKGTGHLVIFVGGRPFNLDPELCGKVGADATAADPQEALGLARTAWEGPAR